MKAFNSIDKGVSSVSELSTKPAIYPMTVLSPVSNTIPFPLP